MRRIFLGLSFFLFACSSSSSPGGEATGDTGTPGDETADTGNGDDTEPPTDGGDDSVTTDSGTGDTAEAPDPFDRSKCTADPDKPGLTTRTAKYKSGSMKYLGYAPAGYDKTKPMSVLLSLHGAGDTMGNYFNAVWKTNADSKKFLVITPEGSSPAGPGFTWLSGDVNLILATLEDFEHCYSVDTHRRIIHGFSAGGIMAYLIGLAAADNFAGISISSANLGSAEAIYGKPLLPAPWLIPVSHTHGTTDTNFPIATARAGRDKLIAAGHKVYWHEFDGGHTTNATFAGTMWDDLASSKAP